MRETKHYVRHVQQTQEEREKRAKPQKPGAAFRTRIWCGQCGCSLYFTPGGEPAYECRVCGWSGDAY